MTDTPKITEAAEAELAQALYRTLHDAGVSFESSSLIPRLTAAVRAARYVKAHTEPPTEDVREALAALIDEQHGNWQWDSLAHGMSAGRYISPMILDRFDVSPKKGQG